jgi:hypothetical protein
MKKHFLLVLTILIVSSLFVGCSFAPVGNPWDYKRIGENNSEGDAPYPLISGKGYHATAMLENAYLGSSAAYNFIAETEDVHCQFAWESYMSAECIVRIDNEKVLDPEDGFDVPKGSALRIWFGTDYVLNGSGSKAFAEFYLYVD